MSQKITKKKEQQKLTNICSRLNVERRVPKT